MVICDCTDLGVGRRSFMDLARIRLMDLASCTYCLGVEVRLTEIRIPGASLQLLEARGSKGQVVLLRREAGVGTSLRDLECPDPR